jgi:polysaccharide export outer membrane protein
VKEATIGGEFKMLRLSLVFGLLMGSASIANAAAPVSNVAGATDNDASYKLAAGDKLRITVYNETTLTGEYSVSAAGNVAMPLVGDVPAKGTTTEALSQAIAGRLAEGYVKDPRVSVEILNYRPYYILGEVNRPGEFPYAVNLTIEQAVAAAGGYTYRASKHSVFLRHAGEVEQRLRFGAAPIYVKPGDTIRIGERYF